LYLGGFLIRETLEIHSPGGLALELERLFRGGRDRDAFQGGQENLILSRHRSTCGGGLILNDALRRTGAGRGSRTARIIRAVSEKRHRNDSK
jgi:hypothetical protein